MSVVLVDEDRTTRSHRRRHLVDDQIERMVERTKRQDHTNRFAPRERHAASRRGINVHRDNFALFGAEYFNAILDTINRSCDLDPRIEQWLAALLGRGRGELVGPFGHDLDRACQDFDTLRRRQPGVTVLVQRCGLTEHGIDFGPSLGWDVADCSAIVWRGYR